MGDIQVLQSISGAVYLATLTTVSVRLLLLARRNRALPELLLGASLLLGGTVGATLEAGAMATAAQMEPSTVGLLVIIGKSFGVIGVGLQALFIRNVFRPNAAWATALGLAMTGAVGCALILCAATGTLATGVVPGSLFVLEFAGRLAGPVWLVCEALRYHGIMKRRLQLGLADVMVVDRFRLWAGAGMSVIVLLGTSVPPMLVSGEAPAWIAWDIALFAAAGMAASTFYLLAFFPPGFYRRRVEARYGGATA